MTRIFLAGFMGAGKTTLGRAMAKADNLEFIDLDQYIEGRYMKTVSQIFAQMGEGKFREIESRLLREVGEFDNVIIATGGSTPLVGDNMDYMLQQGQTVYLKCTHETLSRRLKLARDKRPLIAAMNDDELDLYISRETARREPWYMRSRFICPGDRLESRSQIDDTVSFLNSLLNEKQE